MNLQDGVLNQVRKENVEVRVVLVGGAELAGNVKGFDNFTVVLVSDDQQHLIYKHAIAHIQQSRGENKTGDWKFGIEVPKSRPRGKRPAGAPKSTPDPKQDRPAKEIPTEPRGKAAESKDENEAKRNVSFNSLDFSGVKLPADEKS